jgi:hypothetical protein
MQTMNFYGGNLYGHLQDPLLSSDVMTFTGYTTVYMTHDCLQDS